jgi:hypothetical protein
LRSQMLYGDFQAGTEDHPYQVIPSAWVHAAQARWTENGGQGKELSAMGVDVARGGDDKTVIARRYRNWYAPLLKHPGKSTPDGPAVVALILPLALERKEAPVNIDVIGVGASVYDIARQQKINAVGVNVAEGTEMYDKTGQLEFANLRAYYYWKMREALDPANTSEPIALPPDSELLADLCAVRWMMTPSGAIKLESKDEVKKRIGRSPDCGDALILASIASTPFTMGGPPKGDRNVLERLPKDVFRHGPQIKQWPGWRSIQPR